MNEESVPQHASPQKIEEVLRQAVDAQKKWKSSSVVERARGFEALAGHLRENAMELSLLMQKEMGKTLKEGMAEVEKCAFSFQHFSKHLAEFLTHQFIQDPNLKAEIRLESLGVVFGIMPWNFPLWQTARALLPSVAVGNSFILNLRTWSQRRRIILPNWLTGLFRQVFFQFCS